MESLWKAKNVAKLLRGKRLKEIIWRVVITRSSVICAPSSDSSGDGDGGMIGGRNTVPL